MTAGWGSAPVFPAEHRWPVALSYAGYGLEPFRRYRLKEWSRVRERNRSWLEPWDATSPTGEARRTAAEMASWFNHEARACRMVPWLVTDQRVTKGRPPLIGQCTLSNISFGSVGFASIGYWIDQSYAGQGITPAMVALAGDYAIKVMGLHRLEICIRPENRASLRVVEKLGFRPEGLRPRYIHIAGKWCDHLVFALDASEMGQGLIARLAAQRVTQVSRSGIYRYR